MASSLAPVILTFKADGVIAKGKAVKIGSDSKHVVLCSLASDHGIGVAQGDAAAAEDMVEVAVVGGGAKGLAQATISAGQLLVSHTDGALKKASALGDRVVAVAMEDAVAGDLFDCVVQLGDAAQAQA